MLKLERQLDGRTFLLADELSLAEIPTGCNLFRYFNLDIERPAYREHVMLPFDDLYARRAY